MIKLVQALTGRRGPERGELMRWRGGNVQQILVDAMENLTERQRQVLKERFECGETLAATGEKFGLTRERIRQIEAKALRILRGRLREHFDLLKDSVEIIVIPGGPADPDWIGVKEASRLTDLCEDHIRYLHRNNRIRTEQRFRKDKKGRIRIYKPSLREYVETMPKHNRKRGVWNELQGDSD